MRIGAGQRLTIEDVVRVARHGEPVELAPEALARIRACRAMLDRKLLAHETASPAAALRSPRPTWRC
jgi:histidine ammonia-lyase